MSQRTKRSVSVISILLALALGAFFMRATIASEGRSDASTEPALTMEADVEVLLLRLGFRPEAVAAIGLGGSSMQTVLAAHQNALEAALDGLAARDAAYAEAKVSVDTLRRKVRSGQASPQEVTQLAAAKETLLLATTARENYLDAIFAAICEHIPNNLRAKLVQIRANARWSHLPVQYLVTEHTQAEWIALRNALSAKRTHEKMENSVPQSALDLLATHNANSQVAAAKANRDANLAGVQASWDAIFEH